MSTTQTVRSRAGYEQPGRGSKVVSWLATIGLATSLIVASGPPAQALPTTYTRCGWLSMRVWNQARRTYYPTSKPYQRRTIIAISSVKAHTQYSGNGVWHWKLYSVQQVGTTKIWSASGVPFSMYAPPVRVSYTFTWKVNVGIWPFAEIKRCRLTT